MKHKISRRLIGYFSAVLLLFSLVVGGLFFLLFTLHTAELQAQDLRLHAASIADTVSQFLQNYCEGSCNGGGFRAYLRFVGDFAMSDLWLVDEAGRTVELGQSAGSAPAAPLEPDIAELARAVLSEGSVASASSSLFFDSTLTVGAPVKGADDVAAYALLLRRKIDAVGRAQQDGLVILAFCLLTALVLASALSVLLARRFVTPLKRMARATEQIMEGDYAAVSYTHLDVYKRQVMDTMKKVALRHGLVCLLHEKPFAGVNGSGKHNNWSLITDEGKNLLDPGKNPHENLEFLLMLTAILKAVDDHADVLRFSAANPGNDHRLGANEAPPAIISVFLGEQLEDVVEQIVAGHLQHSKKGERMKIGVSTLPFIKKDATDRNRTSRCV